MIADDLDRVLDEEYVAGVAILDTEDLKSRRAECQQVEAKLSYLRRLVQGRLDIVSAELERRVGGQAGGDLSDLVERLPEILADRVRAPGPGRMPTNLVPPDDDELTAEVDAISGPNALTSLPDLSEEELRDVSARLADLERRVSAQRKAVFGVIDKLQDELASRYEQMGTG